MKLSVGQMDKVVQASAARAEEGAAVAQDLIAQSTALQQSVDELNHLIGGKASSHRGGHATLGYLAAVHAESKEPALAHS